MLSSDNVVTQAKKATPWSSPWWVSLIEGIVLAAIGIYLIYDPRTAIGVFGRLIALYLFVAGLFQTLASLQKPATNFTSKLALWRGMIGAILGGIVVILSFVVGWLSPLTALRILAIATFLYGLIGFYLAFAQKTRGSGRLLAVLGSILFIVVGFTALFLEGRNVVDTWVGPTFTVLGIALVGFAFIRRSQQHAARAEADAAAAAASVTASDASSPNGAAAVSAATAPAATAPAATPSSETPSPAATSSGEGSASSNS